MLNCCMTKREQSVIMVCRFIKNLDRTEFAKLLNIRIKRCSTFKSKTKTVLNYQFPSC
jgi:DNA-directed RNA polymerase specialized sigma subunit